MTNPDLPGTVVKHQCTHCGALVEAIGPHISIDMDKTALAGLGRAIIETRLLHCIFDCPALEGKRPEARP